MTRLLHLLPLLVVPLSIAGCGPLPPSDTCLKYVACQAEYDAAAGTGPVDTAQYEADGVCWTSQENAARCDEQCADGTAANREASASAGFDTPSCD